MGAFTFIRDGGKQDRPIPRKNKAAGSGELSFADSQQSRRCSRTGGFSFPPYACVLGGRIGVEIKKRPGPTRQVRSRNDITAADIKLDASNAKF